MIHQPNNEAEEALKKVLQNVSLKLGKMQTSIVTFPVNHAVRSIIMNQCVWSVLDLSKDD